MSDRTRTNGRIGRLLRAPVRLLRYPLGLVIRPLGRLRQPLGALGRALLDAIILALWVVALTAIFLTTGWPRLWFYAALIGGAVLYALFTSSWWSNGSPSD